MDSLLSTGTSFNHPSSVFPSDLSSSSGPSLTSTRDTSPDTLHHHHTQYHPQYNHQFQHPFSNNINHHHHHSHQQQPTPPDSNLTSPVEDQSCAGASSSSPFLSLPGMERSPFDSANGRRNKIMLERAGTSHVSGDQAHGHGNQQYANSAHIHQQQQQQNNHHHHQNHQRYQHQHGGYDSSDDMRVHNIYGPPSSSSSSSSSPPHVTSRSATSSNWRVPGAVGMDGTVTNSNSNQSLASPSFTMANSSPPGYANDGAAVLGGGGGGGGGAARMVFSQPVAGTTAATDDLSLAHRGPPQTAGQLQLADGGCGSMNNNNNHGGNNNNNGRSSISSGGSGGGGGSNSGSSSSTAAIPDNMYAYCFDRGNGQYTRLVPADVLPPLQDVPALQQGCAGMVVLPVPRGLAPNGRSSNSERVSLQPRTLPSGTLADPIQSHIDTIVASSPPPNPQRRPKIYCDKWVHEGVCAFTQQGCKYKHEMPFDKATQHSLGLFHGLPAWWKKHQAELARQQDAAHASDQPVALTSRDRPGLAGPSRLSAAPAASASAAANTPWRRPLDPPAPVAQFSSPFGPIGPPIRKAVHHDQGSPSQLITRGMADMNPFSMLRQQRGEDDDRDGMRTGRTV